MQLYSTHPRDSDENFCFCIHRGKGMRDVQARPLTLCSVTRAKSSVCEPSTSKRFDPWPATRPHACHGPNEWLC